LKVVAVSPPGDEINLNEQRSSLVGFFSRHDDIGGLRICFGKEFDHSYNEATEKDVKYFRGSFGEMFDVLLC
jgi:hypothetical protein